MKKYFLTATVLCLALSFTACGSNTGADSLDKAADIPEENQTDIRGENQADIRKEDETVPQQDSEPASNDNIPRDNIAESEERAEEQTEMKMNVQIGDYFFTATLENNAAVEELLDMMKEGPVTVQMDDYSGFEKVGPLGKSLTTSNSQTTTAAGDIVLYNGNNIVMFTAVILGVIPESVK